MAEGPAPGRRSTIADVAARAGVDRAVVSRLLNDDPRLSIRESTRQRVLAAIKDLGYQPNAAARSLRTARTRTLGLLVPNYVNPAYGEIIKGAEAAANLAGTSLMTASLAGVDGSFERYIEHLGHGRVDGLLLVAGGVRGIPEDELARLGVPWLCVNRLGPTKRRYVVLDDERAAAVAIEHLVGLGHTRIGLLGGPDDSDTARRRRRGYLKAMRAAGLESGPIVGGHYTPDGGAAGMARLLADSRPPTAVLVANVASAIGAIYTARRAKVRVPRDLSVIAVHDLELGAYLDPPLTTIRMSLDGLGARAVELLLSTAPDADVREVVREPIELQLRESTAPPRR